jgi:hypothetical protein
MGNCVITIERDVSEGGHETFEPLTKALKNEFKINSN